jgi:hypothetical protein
MSKTKYDYIENYEDYFKRLVADYKNKGLWVASSYRGTQQVYTHSNQTWRHMKSRCLVGSLFQDKKPTYKGCSVSDDFSDFQYFTKWHTGQKGYRHLNYQLDKDILVKGNKLYSPDTCLLVPAFVNAFCCDTANTHKGLAGVRQQENFFRATIHDGVKNKHLGVFKTSEEAKEAYKYHKCLAAKELAKLLLSKNIVIDSRVIATLNNWEDRFND